MEENAEAVMTKEEQLEEAVKKFQETSKAMLQAFLFIEENLKEAAQLCVNLEVLLEEDKPKPNPNQTNIFEGDINVN